MDLLLQRKIRKQRLIRLTIAACLVVVAVLTYLESRVFQLGAVEFPISGNVLVFALINCNVLLLLLVVFLVLRNLAELIFERKKNLLGSRLRTKMVVSFMSLSLIPTALLFFVALQFISTSMDYWFNINVEESLVTAHDLARSVYQQQKEDLRRQTEKLAETMENFSRLPNADRFQRAADDLLAKQEFSSVSFVTGQNDLLAGSIREKQLATLLLYPSLETIRKAFKENGTVMTLETEEGEFIQSVNRLMMPQASEKNGVLLVVSKKIDAAQLHTLTMITRGLEGYRQLMLLKKPIKTSLLVMLLIVTLLIVFSAVWFGFYVANSLTVPIGKLADATRRIAEGDLDFVLEKESGDEMGTLVDSFNQMTKDLKNSQQQVEAASDALKDSNIALEERRRYTEIILQNVTAGVISLDQDGRITTINRYAEELLQIDRRAILDRHYRSVLRLAHMTVLEKFLTELTKSGKSSIRRHVGLTIKDETFSLQVSFVRLEDEKGNSLGVVLVFDNLTELEKAQRMAAWREVARRIAHEVKNPLTPIQLSAQRLRKKYLERLAGEEEVFDACTRTIVNQVDELKRLVSEFSSFARMPAIKKSLNDMAEMVEEALVLFREAHPDIGFSFNDTTGRISFSFDRAQIRRVFVNLLDNAVAALAEAGEIKVSLNLRKEDNMVLLEVEDNGPGVSEEDKLRLFEPYFSTKKTGTGLGLAIASTIIADHGGYLRVKNVAPHGAKFMVELPFVNT
jgi:two-component system nitrogen regulation sensor histidine kinase NtrY